MNKKTIALASIAAFALTFASQAAEPPTLMPAACKEAKGADDAKSVLAACTDSAGLSVEKRGWVYFYRAYAHVELGELEEADATLKRGIEIAPRLANLRHERGYVLIDLGDFDAAEVNLTEALRLEPAAPNHSQERGYARMAKGDYAGAAGDFDVYLKAKDDAQNRAMRAYVLALAGDPAAARDELAKLKPGTQTSYQAAANAVLGAIKPGDDKKGALAACLAAPKQSKLPPAAASTCTWAMRHATSPLEKATALRIRSLVWQFAIPQPEAAASDIEAAIRLHPNDAASAGQQCAVLRGTARTERRMKHAIASCARAIQLCGTSKPCAAKSVLNHGWGSFAVRDNKTALADANVLIASDPKGPDGYHLRGAVKVASGDTAGGKADLLEAKKRGSKSPDLRELLKALSAGK